MRWTPKGLIFGAILWAWSDEESLTKRLFHARKVVIARNILARIPAATYQAFLKLGTTWTGVLATVLFDVDVVTREVIAPTVQPRRTEEGFAGPIKRTVATDPEPTWVFVCDNLTTHCSESLVRYVSEACGIEGSLGKKRKSGVLKSVETRKAFLRESGHRIRFVYVPKHTSWLNQIEI